MRHLVAVGISHLGSDKVPIRKWRDKSPNLVDGHVEVTLLQSELGSYLHLVTGKFSHFMIPGRQIVYSILFFSLVLLQAGAPASKVCRGTAPS